MTVKLTLAAARNRPWDDVIEIIYTGDALPLTGAAIAMQVRLYPGAPDAPLIDLADIAFEDVEAPTADSPTRRILRLSPSIPEATLAALPTGLNKPEVGEADAYAYDIILTYADGPKDALAYGQFLVEPGVTVDA